MKLKPLHDEVARKISLPLAPVKGHRIAHCKSTQAIKKAYQIMVSL